MPSTSHRAWASPRLSDHDDEYVFRNNKADMLPKTTTTKNRHKIKRLRHPTDGFLLIRLCHLIIVFILNCTLFVLCVCLWVTVIPVVLLIRTLVAACCVKINNSNGSLNSVSSWDSLWLTPFNNNLRSNMFFLLEGHINVEELRDFVNDKWLYYCVATKKHRFPKLRKCTTELCSSFAWNQIDDFRTDDYVGSTERNGLEINDIEPLEESYQLDQINSNGDTKKMWKVTVFPKFLDTDDSGVLFQMHQSMADIFPFARFIFESLGYKTVYLKHHCFPIHRLCLYFCTAFIGPLTIIRRLLRSKANTILDRKDFSIQSGVLQGQKKVFWSEAIDMKNIKKVKDISRTKVNVILMSCLAGALRTYFKMCGIEHPDDIRACIQMDTRPQHSKLRLDNHFSNVFVDLPSGTEGAVPRLWDMKGRMEDFNAMIEGFAFYGFLRFCLILLPLSLVRRVVDFLLAKSSCTVTFLSGPTTPVYFNGKMAKYMTFWNPRPNSTGLSLSIATYANHMRLGAVFHQNQPCDPNVLLTEFQKEVDNLSKHLSQRTLPSHLRLRARQQVMMQQDNEDNEQPSDSPV